MFYFWSLTLFSYDLLIDRVAIKQTRFCLMTRRMLITDWGYVTPVSIASVLRLVTQRSSPQRSVAWRAYKRLRRRLTLHGTGRIFDPLFRSHGTALTVQKFRRLAVQSSSWTERKCWTVPCERRGQSNFCCGQKFVVWTQPEMDSNLTCYAHY